jgi:D-xylulose reductase
MEPLAVAVHAISTLGKFRSGQSIAVLGCGPIGLLCMAAAKAMGAERIIGVDISPPRLAFAKEYIATDVWKPVPPEEGDQGMAYAFRNSTAMKEALGFGDVGPGSIDLVVDATGVASSIETGPFIAKYGGGFVLVNFRLFPISLC